MTSTTDRTVDKGQLGMDRESQEGGASGRVRRVDRLPPQTSLLVGVHSGGALTMDAWTLVAEWYRRFGDERILHGIAHDVLMAAPGLGHYFRATGAPRARR